MRSPFGELSANVATPRAIHTVADRWCGIEADTPQRPIASPTPTDWRKTRGVEEKADDDHTICLHHSATDRSGASVVRVAMDSPHGLLETFGAAVSALALAIQPEYFRATWTQRNLGAGRPRRMEARKRLQQAQDDALAALEVVRAVKTMDGAHAAHLEDQLRVFAAQVDALRDAAQRAEEQSAAAAEVVRAAHAQQLATAVKAHAQASADARDMHSAARASAADAHAAAARERDALTAALQAELRAARRSEAEAEAAEAAARSAAVAARSAQELQHAAECARLRAAAARVEGECIVFTVSTFLANPAHNLTTMFFARKAPPPPRAMRRTPRRVRRCERSKRTRASASPIWRRSSPWGRKRSPRRTLPSLRPAAC